MSMLHNATTTQGHTTPRGMQDLGLFDSSTSKFNSGNSKLDKIDYDNINPDVRDEIIIYHVNDSVSNHCPHIDLSFGSKQSSFILNSGAQGSIISERVYNKLIYAGVSTMELAVQGAVLLNAFGERTRRIKK
jgi:hypothetical protein